MPFLGGFAHVVRGQLPEKPGQLMLFRALNDGAVCLKRLASKGVAENGTQKFWVSADGKGVNGEDSDQYGWVPARNVIGVVDSLWSPKRAWRDLTVGGRFRNRLEFTCQPGEYAWSRNGKFCLTVDGQVTDRFGRQLATKPVHGYVASDASSDSGLVYKDRRQVIHSYNPASGRDISDESGFVFQSLSDSLLSNRKRLMVATRDRLEDNKAYVTRTHDGWLVVDKTTGQRWVKPFEDRLPLEVGLYFE
jgi:hypothetical protein